MQITDQGFLEVLDTYMDMVEKQEEIIYRLSKIVKRQAYEIAHMKNVCGFSEEKAQEEIEEDRLAQEALSKYEELKNMD
ncbi:MAG: hypothetical protein BHV88_17045 [Clostridiales bacterium 41_12_two_minus]|nr:MAG: hypothetical protein BHV88_17045 [Clostridiales bacterium 41_12_two_minus]